MEARGEEHGRGAGDRDAAMIAEAGNFALILGLVFACIQAAVPLVGAARRDGLIYPPSG